MIITIIMAIIITTMVIIIIMIIINMKLKMFQPHHILYNKPRQSQQCNVKPASELLLNTNKLSEILQQSMPNIAYMIYIAYLCKYVCMCVRGKTTGVFNNVLPILYGEGKAKESPRSD